MKKSIAENQWFYLPFLTIMIICTIVLLIFTKPEIHIFCNKYYSGFTDYFFSYITNLGDGIFLPLYVLIMLFISFRYSILLVMVFLLSGLFVQLIKHLLFYDSLRPLKYFESVCTLHVVNGVHPIYYHSFPSGHSATAFCIFLCFALVSKYNWVKFSLFVFALLIAYSRVYLSQHFLVDVVAGSWIGVLVTLFSYHWMNTLRYSWLDKKLMITKHKSTHETFF